MWDNVGGFPDEMINKWKWTELYHHFNDSPLLKGRSL